MVHTTNEVPTAEQFEKAQEEYEAIGENEPYGGPYFAYCHAVEEFDDYTEFLSYVAAKNAQTAADNSSELVYQTDSAIDAGKILLLALGAGALVEAVIGDARF